MPYFVGKSQMREGFWPRLTVREESAPERVVPAVDTPKESPAGSSQPADRAAPEARTSVGMANPPARPRNIGIDVARGVALVGMIANHTYPEVWHNSGKQTIPQILAGGRASATFALLAGVGIALMSGGRRPVEGRARAAARAGLFVRGLLILTIGLVLAYTEPDGNVDIILAYFGLYFIFAIPLLGLRPRDLWVAAFAIAVLVPVVLHLFAGHLPDLPFDTNPDFGSFIHPIGLLVALCCTGFYPALPWMAFICAGLAAGRLDLSSPRIAVWLLVGGLSLAAAAWGVSSFLLHPLGGLHDLLTSIPRHAGMSPADVRELANRGEVGILPGWSWWWLVVRAPHTAAPLDLLHVMGSALALLGGMLLLTRVAIFARVLTPLALAGGMTLTIYSAHVIIIPLTGDSNFGAQLAVQIAVALAFAVVWRRRFARGPLETVLAVAARWARRAVMSAPGGLATPREASSAVPVQSMVRST